MNFLLFGTLFDYGFMQGAPVYVASLDPQGMFSAAQLLPLYVTVLAAMFVVIDFDLWPLTKNPRLMKQPTLGLVWMSVIVALGGAVFYTGTVMLGIDPMIFLLFPNTRNFYSLKVESANLPQTIAGIRKTWDKYFPADPIEYSFLDETFGQQYKADQLFGKVFGVFAFLAILIACFGLLGLSAYNVLQRTKEIGIRKVLGASVQNILFLLSTDFLKLIIIALFIAIPVGWWVMNSWLQDFAYRISIHWWVFIIAAVIAVLIAFFTISTQAVKAAITSPVKSLRTE